MLNLVKQNALRNTILFSCFLFINIFCFEQYQPFERYWFSNEIAAKSKTGNSRFDSAFEYSCIGEYFCALRAYEKQQSKPLATLSKEQESYFNIFKPTNAQNFIIERAKKRRILLINEAHHNPSHRVFTTSLLKDLYDQGFKYFGVETLVNRNETVSDINKRKFPVLTNGYYLKEPLYADMLREALRIGYIVFAYESKNHDVTASERERNQAENIKKILDLDSNAKVLVHCGWSHIYEGPVPDWGKAMAGRLLELTGIDPFTIDQTKLSEQFSTEFESPYYKKISFNSDAILVDSINNPFYGPVETKLYDARVYHPRSKIIHGRPQWMFENKRIPYFIPESLLKSFPVLIFAYVFDEKQNAMSPIPFDVIELKNSNDRKALSLRRNIKFSVIIRDPTNTSKEFPIEIK